MKKILAAVVMAVIAFVSFGCGELTFEQTPYTKSDKNEAKIVEFLTEKIKSVSNKNIVVK